MIDHLSVPVRDLAKSKAFYAQALAPLGYVQLHEYPGVAAFGADGIPDFWIVEQENANGTLHVALRARARQAVHDFHREALAAGGKDNGAPGPRPHYTPTCYAAFVFDPDGHNVEVVTHEAEGASR